MNYVERAIEKSLTHIIIAGASDPGTLGMQRENAVLAILGAFRVSSKSVLQRHLGLSREAVNKLVNRMKKKQLITMHSSFANTDKGFILLTSQGIREAEFLLNRELHLRSDSSRINERNLIHDLSVQIVILDLAKRQQITGFASEKDLAILLENRGNDPRLVDGLVVDADTGCTVAIEMETSNAKNKGNGKLREGILSKYLQELQDINGLYEFVYMYSHRQRFLTQIEKAHSRLFSANRSQFSPDQQTLLTSRIKFKAQECNVIYELMFNSKRQLGDDKLELVRKDSYLQQLEELEKLAHTTEDRVIQIRRDGFIEAGKLMGLIE